MGGFFYAFVYPQENLMTLKQLKYLLGVVDNGLNITSAADRLYTSQPGISKQLKQPVLGKLSIVNANINIAIRRCL